MSRRYRRSAPERCHLCNVLIPWERRRMNRRYCTDACKQAMYRIRRQIKEKAIAGLL